MNVRILALAGALAGVTFASAVSAQSLPPQSLVPVRGDRGSDRNLRGVRHRLESLIDQMQHDQRDYGGHRLKAIADLQAARAEIDAGLSNDNSH